mmetsp:Transcript_32395/g.78870  ORF Transcript_32395/g.78870 Transcript_32395/m.78870 type:complete len:87 (+) Transcript_32395:95-355(+)
MENASPFDPFSTGTMGLSPLIHSPIASQSLSFPWEKVGGDLPDLTGYLAPENGTQGADDTLFERCSGFPVLDSKYHDGEEGGGGGG